MKRKLIILSTFLLLGSLFVNAQTESSSCEAPRLRDNWYIGINGGIINYFGTFSPDGTDDMFRDPINIGFGAVIGKQLSPVLSLRAEFLYGKIESAKGSDAQPWKMDADYRKVGFTAEINLINIFKYNQYRFFNIYYLVGLNAASSDGKAWIYPAGGDEDQVVNYLGRIRSFSWGANTGLGISLSLTRHLNFTIESQIAMYDNTFDGNYGSDIATTNNIFYTSAGLTYKFTNKRFLSQKEEKVCLEKQIKDQTEQMKKELQNAVDEAAKKAIEPVRQDVETLKKENCCKDLNDLKARVSELEKRPRQEAKTVGNYVGWSDLDPNAEVVQGNSPVASVFFPFNSAVVETSQNVIIDGLANYIKKNPSIKTIIIEGYADKFGPDAVNETISRQRAEAVKALLVKKGVNAKMLKVEAMGKTTKYSEENTDLNRRVFFKIEK